MGHPWIEDTIVLIRKQPNLFADISALHYRPWQFYNALIAAKEYGVLNKLLFGRITLSRRRKPRLPGMHDLHRLTEGDDSSAAGTGGDRGADSPADFGAAGTGETNL